MRAGICAALLALGIVLICLAAFWAWAEEFPHVTAEELKKMIESEDQSILIVDVQPREVYRSGHIKGAVNLPWASDVGNPAELPRDKTLILYCDCAHEEDSTEVARQLSEKWDYTHIKILQSSWSNWQKLGYPVEK